MTSFKMATISPTVSHFAQKVTQLKSEVPLPKCWPSLKYILIFLLTLSLLLALYSHSGKNDLELGDIEDLTFDLNDDLEAAGKVNKSSLIIYTRYRSGSSLIGELFNRHPDVFYVFEPFKLFPAGRDWNSFIRTQASGYLFELNRCNFQGIINDSISLPNAQEDSMKSWIRRSFCGKTKVTPNRGDDKKCKRASLMSIERLCRKYSWVVTKTIRIYDVTALVPYLQQDHKVVNLLRDPRGMISSRIKIQQIKANQSDERFFRDMGRRLMEIRTDAEKACLDIRENFQAISQLVNEVPEFQKLFYTMRYEDFAENPVEQARLLYRFAGLDFHQSVHEWLTSATSGVDPTQQRPGSLKYSYSTDRDSSVKTANAWRLHLPFKVIRAIQKICYRELVVLGYIPVDNIIELTDMNFKLYQNFTLPWT